MTGAVSPSIPGKEESLWTHEGGGSDAELSSGCALCPAGTATGVSRETMRLCRPEDPSVERRCATPIDSPGGWPRVGGRPNTRYSTTWAGSNLALPPVVMVALLPYRSRRGLRDGAGWMRLALRLARP